jgi:hypothetical protein
MLRLRVKAVNRGFAMTKDKVQLMDTLHTPLWTFQEISVLLLHTHLVNGKLA